MMEHLERVWQLPDDGIWEIRGPQRHFTQSKVMAWVAFDRAVKIVEHTGRQGMPIDRWREIADQIKAEVCEKGFNKEKNSFVQYYGSDQLDSSLLMLARVGFLPPSDPRIIGTVEAIERELMVDGFVQRYPTSDERLGRRASRPGRARSCSRRSGSSTTSRSSAARRRRASCSSGCGACRTTSACSPRSTTPTRSG